MDELRLKRYRDKIGFITEQFTLLEVEPRTPLEEQGILHVLQTSIEAGVDLIAMTLKDLGITVNADYQNIETLVSEGIVAGELGDRLKRLNGFRNAIVHHYNGLEEEVVLESQPFVQETLHEWLKIVEGILNAETE